jgi:hypothetical protein
MTWRREAGRLLASGALLVALTATLGFGAAAAPPAQKRFPTAEDATKALVEAAKSRDASALLAILGSDAKPLITSGDPVRDRRAHERFVQAFAEASRLESEGAAKTVLILGKDEWPFPIPLVKEAGGWRFDTAAGKEEILNRRVGENELSTIQVCLAYVDAQREYYRRNPDGGTLLEYAQKFASTKGKRDGLYWESKPGELPSPFGPAVAKARGEGYAHGQAGAPIAYWGYYYRILKEQGTASPGGAYDYMVRGHMMGGFALVAFPAQYGVTGVMTFMVNHDGVVYQKDLGPQTASIAKGITKFNPDDTWKKV